MNQLNIKIICTLGPSSFDGSVLRRMEEFGVSLFRINLSHTDLDQIQPLIEQIREVTSVPLCIDTEGAQIRTGRIGSGDVHFRIGDSITLVREDVVGNESVLTLKPPEVFDSLRAGTMLSLDFNAALVLVTEVATDWARAKFLSGGLVGSNKGVTSDNLISLPSMTAKDRAAVQIAAKLGVSQFALSFADQEDSVLALRSMVGSGATIISKVESLAGLRGLEGIIQATDAILIDRGDLSREVPVENIPFLQKRIINKAHLKPAPVYVATNLLESMVSSPYPSRAEVSDIISTMLDGATGLVLAAETAIGRYPVECVAMVRRLVDQYLSEAWPSIDFDSAWRGNGMLPGTGTMMSSNKPRQPIALTHKQQNGQNAGGSVRVGIPTLLDLEQINNGAYAPVNGFMSRTEINGVLDHYKLQDGTTWTMPVVLQVDSSSIDFYIGDEISLVCECCLDIVAEMGVDDIYRFDLASVASRWFGSESPSHPGVARLRSNGDCFIGGTISLVKPHRFASPEYSLTPPQVRSAIAHNGWNQVIGFHTRNSPHRAHEFIQLSALERVGDSALFINPALGQKKRGDFSQEAILAGYGALMRSYLPGDRVLMSGFFGNSWYSGPREAVFTAICRRNYGCTHFIVGRDHTGVGEFYGPQGVQRLFDDLGDLGIMPVFFDEVVFDPREDCYREVRPGDDGGRVERISGTDIREFLLRGEVPPERIMRREVSEALLGLPSSGFKVFVD